MPVSPKVESPRKTTLCDNDLARNCPLDNGRHHLVPKFSLGALDRLPWELLSAVLVHTDLQTLTNFRRVNQRAMDVVDSLPQYQAILVHIPNALRGILSIGTGHWITCQLLYDKLCTAECERCGDFGDYLYIVTAKRVCYLCFTENETFVLLKREDATLKFGLRRIELAYLPQMKSIPGRYGSSQRYQRAGLTLYDFESARNAGIAVYGSIEWMEMTVGLVESSKWARFNKRVARKAANPAAPTPHRPRTVSDIVDEHEFNPNRFMAIVRAPWLNPHTKISTMGFQCPAHIHYYGKPSHPCYFRRKFTAESFAEHIKEHGVIKNSAHCPA